MADIEWAASDRSTCAGMAVRASRPAFAERMDRPVRIGSAVILALLVLGAPLATALGLPHPYWSVISAIVVIQTSVGGGVLVAALVIGWYNSRHPEIGALPPAARSR